MTHARADSLNALATPTATIRDPVEKIMNAPLVTVKAASSLRTAAPSALPCRRHLPVLRDSVPY